MKYLMNIETGLPWAYDESVGVRGIGTNWDDYIEISKELFDALTKEDGWIEDDLEWLRKHS